MRAQITPHITEKSYRTISETGDVSSTYTFKVASNLDKAAIAKKVEKEHSVHVISVNIINLPGKARRFKGIRGHTATLKKALVRLKKGERISSFNVEEKSTGDNS